MNTFDEIRGWIMRGARLLLIGLAGLVLSLAPPAFGQADVSSATIEKAIPATVKLWIVDSQGRSSGWCSGSIVAPRGIILTASHCVRATEDVPRHDEPDKGLKRGSIHRVGELYNPEGLLLVGLNLPGRDVPVPLYYAKLIADVPGLTVLDMAIAQIVADYDRGREPIQGRLHLPALRIGDASRVRVGDRVAILGFPGLGGSTITVVKGDVVGFYPDYLGRSRRFLKDDTMASPGHSGGPIINSAGEQIAVVSSGEEGKGAQIGYNPLVNFMPSSWAAQLQGAPPTAAPLPPQTANQAVLTGSVRDALTGRGIEGAVVLVWRLGIDLRRATAHDTISVGETDASGEFRTDFPVPKGATYPVTVRATGYQTAEGNVIIAPDDPDVIRLKDVPLQRL